MTMARASNRRGQQRDAYIVATPDGGAMLRVRDAVTGRIVTTLRFEPAEARALRASALRAIPVPAGPARHADPTGYVAQPCPPMSGIDDETGLQG